MARKFYLIFGGLFLLAPSLACADIAVPPRRVPYLKSVVPETINVMRIGIGMTVAMFAFTLLLWRRSRKGAIAGFILVLVTGGLTFFAVNWTREQNQLYERDRMIRRANKREQIRQRFEIERKLRKEEQLQKNKEATTTPKEKKNI